jgi:hypothetical protein
MAVGLDQTGPLSVSIARSFYGNMATLRKFRLSTVGRDHGNVRFGTKRTNSNRRARSTHDPKQTADGVWASVPKRPVFNWARHSKPRSGFDSAASSSAARYSATARVCRCFSDQSSSSGAFPWVAACFKRAGVDRKALALDEAHGHCGSDNALEDVAQHVALVEATQPVGREGRVMRDLVFEIELAKPAIR